MVGTRTSAGVQVRLGGGDDDDGGESVRDEDARDARCAS